MLEIGQYQTSSCSYSRAAHGVAEGIRPGQKFVDPVQILGKVAQGVVAAFLHQLQRVRVALAHLVPVQHLVALGDQHHLGCCRRHGAGVELAQFLNVFGAKEEGFLRVMPAGLLADVFSRSRAGLTAGLIITLLQRAAGPPSWRNSRPATSP
jgi:hypothetical protein